MRRRIKDSDGNYIWFDNEEEYQAYLRAIRNSWPNKIKRWFYTAVAIFFALGLLSLCLSPNENEKTSSRKVKTEVRKKTSANKEDISINKSKKEIEKTIKKDEQPSVVEEKDTPDSKEEQSEVNVEESRQVEEPSHDTPNVEE